MLAFIVVILYNYAVTHTCMHATLLLHMYKYFK